MEVSRARRAQIVGGMSRRSGAAHCSAALTLAVLAAAYLLGRAPGAEAGAAVGANATAATAATADVSAAGGPGDAAGPAYAAGPADEAGQHGQVTT